MLGEVVWGLFLWTKHIKIIIRCSRKREIKSSLGSCIIIIIIIVLLLKCPVINSEKISLKLFEQRTSIHRRWRIMGVLSCKTRLKHFCVTCTTSGYIHESNFKPTAVTNPLHIRLITLYQCTLINTCISFDR